MAARVGGESGTGYSHGALGIDCCGMRNPHKVSHTPPDPWFGFIATPEPMLLRTALADHGLHQLSLPPVKNRVVMTSMAALTPLGLNREVLWSALRANRILADRGMISEPQLSQARSQARAHAAGLGLVYPTHRIQPASKSPSKCHTDFTDGFAVPESGWLDRSIDLGTCACLQALAEAQWSNDICSQDDTALLVATSKGPILLLLEACAAMRRGLHLPPHLAWHIAMGPAALQAALTEIIRPGGPIQTHVAACAGSFIAVKRAWDGIRRGEFKRAVIVATDASIHPLFEQSFENLGVFAKPGEDGHRHCHPFAPAGGGFFITEAAAAICLEAGAAGTLEVENCWMGADATHLLAIDPQGSSLERGLRMCAAGRKIAFVHAHAAGTQHDQVELAAIERACGADSAVFSHKRSLGHALGASGLIGLVISAMCHQNNMLPDGRAISRPARSITIGQGFGGHIGMCVMAG